MARRKRQFTDMRDGAGFVKISPFVDRKICEYASRLLESSYLKSKPEAVFRDKLIGLSNVLGLKFRSSWNGF